MPRTHTAPLLVLASVAAFAGATLTEKGARACGGCFHQPSPTEATVVTDHRMAFSVGPTQTVLWDQIQYRGNPSEFVWVLPVHPGTHLELSHDEWIAALDASTQPIVQAPAQYYGGSSSGTQGCGCASKDEAASGVAGSVPPPVQVISQQVVGPYETVTLRSTDGAALETWLTQHGYEIPTDIKPVIDAYVAEGFDFIALRLRPGQGVNAMRPVRVVTPGADPSLPLRMVAAGVGASVGITLYVLGEGRWEAQSFPNATVDDTQLTWDFATDSSNYQTLLESLMGQAGSRTWVTEYAQHPVLYMTGRGTGPVSASGNPGLADAYFSTCTGLAPAATFKTGDAGALGEAGADDGGADAASDAGDDAASGGDGGADDASAAAGDAGGPPDDACAAFDDLNVAMVGLHSTDVMVTRMRAKLPVDALKVGDLRLRAATSQGTVQNVHYARTSGSTSGQVRAGGIASSTRLGEVITLGLALAATGAMLRRRRR